jgi:hypothetical protein
MLNCRSCLCFLSVCQTSLSFSFRPFEFSECSVSEDEDSIVSPAVLSAKEVLQRSPRKSVRQSHRPSLVVPCICRNRARRRILCHTAGLRALLVSFFLSQYADTQTKECLFCTDAGESRKSLPGGNGLRRQVRLLCTALFLSCRSFVADAEIPQTWQNALLLFGSTKRG